MSVEAEPVNPRPTRRERRRQATRAEIVAAARDLLRSGEPISLRSIAHTLGLTAPALYRYVDSYEGLISAVADDIYADIVAELEDAKKRGDAEPAVQIILAAVAFRRWSLGHRAEFALLFTNPVTGPFAAETPGPTRITAEMTPAVPPARQRFGDFFAGIYRALWERYRFALPTEVELGPELSAALRAPQPEPGAPQSAAQHLLDVPPGLGWVFTRAWSRLYGTVTLEVFGHLDPELVRTGALFQAMLADNAAELHIGDRLAELRPILAAELSR
jgi:AcrR family transcriptional regulator